MHAFLCVYVTVCACVLAACDCVNVDCLLGSLPEIGEVHLLQNKQLRATTTNLLKRCFPLKILNKISQRKKPQLSQLL